MERRYLHFQNSSCVLLAHFGQLLRGERVRGALLTCKDPNAADILCKDGVLNIG